MSKQGMTGKEHLKTSERAVLVVRKTRLISLSYESLMPRYEPSMLATPRPDMGLSDPLGGRDSVKKERV